VTPKRLFQRAGAL